MPLGNTTIDTWNLKTTSNFRTEHTFSITKEGNSNTQALFNPPKKITGPAIIKMNGIGSTNDLSVSAGFDGVLVDN